MRIKYKTNKYLLTFFKKKQYIVLLITKKQLSGKTKRLLMHKHSLHSLIYTIENMYCVHITTGKPSTLANFRR